MAVASARPPGPRRDLPAARPRLEGAAHARGRDPGADHGRARSPSALVSCSLIAVRPAVDRRRRRSSSCTSRRSSSRSAPGKKPDVNVKFREADGIEFAGPLDVRQPAQGHHPVRRLQRPALPRRHRGGHQGRLRPRHPRPRRRRVRARRTSASARTSGCRSSTSRSRRLQLLHAARTRSGSQVALFAGGGFFGDHDHPGTRARAGGGVRVRRRHLDQPRRRQRRRLDHGRDLLPARDDGDGDTRPRSPATSGCAARSTCSA